MKKVTWIKSSLLTPIILLNTQTLPLFTKITKAENIHKVVKMSSWKAWVYSPSGLSEMSEEARAL
jgi:hypothetical protein